VTSIHHTSSSSTPPPPAPIPPLPLPDALPISLLDPLEAVRLERPRELDRVRDRECHVAIQLQGEFGAHRLARLPECVHVLAQPLDRKSTRLNSSHQIISYAVCGLI